MQWKKVPGWLLCQVSRMGVLGSRSPENLGKSEYMENVKKNETDTWKLGENNKIIT